MVSDRISVQYHSNQDFNPMSLEPNSHMIKEDLSRIVGSNDKFTCNLVPHNLEFQKLLCNILPSTHDRYYKLDFNEAVAEAIEYIGSYLAYQGILIFEFIKLGEDVSPRFAFKRIYGEKLIIKKNKIIQIIPDEIARQLNCSTSIFIPRDKCFVFEFAKSLGGPKKYLKFLSKFKSISENSPLVNYHSNPLIKATGYDLMEHNRISEMYLWKQSKIVNWHHRSTEKYFTGYYNTFRRISFRRSKIIIRDCIIEDFKKMIIWLGRKMGTDTEIQITCNITETMINEKLREWESGAMDVNTFTAVL